jgi:hypothetical protein
MARAEYGDPEERFTVSVNGISDAAGNPRVPAVIRVDIEAEYLPEADGGHP